MPKKKSEPEPAGETKAPAVTFADRENWIILVCLIFSEDIVKYIWEVDDILSQLCRILNC